MLGEARRDLLPRLEPLLDHAALAAFQAEVPKVRASDALVDYVLRLVEATRTQPAFALGLSPRGSLALLAAARAWALLAGRDYVIPGYTDLMVDGAPLPHQPDTIIRWLIDRLRS